MKKAKRKWVCNGLIILMALCMLSTSALAAVADGNTILPRYVGITEINATLTIDRTDKATCESDVALKNPTYRADVTMTLYRSSDGNKWTSIKSWSGSGKSQIKLSQNYYVLSGYYYKVEVTAKVYNAASTLLETVSAASETIYH